MESVEIWKEVENFEDYYLVSSLGRVYSKIKNRLLNPCKNSKRMPHMYIDVKFKGKRIKLYIHRLVATAFIPNPENYPEIDHIDCNPTNNSVDNLRWCNRKQNQLNPISLSHQYQNQPTSRPIVQLKNNTVIKIYNSIKEASREGFITSAICNCCRHKSKSHKGFQWLYLDEYNDTNNLN